MKFLTAIASCLLVLCPTTEGRTVSMPDKNGVPGNEVVFPVTLDDASGCASIQIQLNYDLQILEFVRFETGSGLGSQFEPTSFAENGVLTLIWTRATGLVSGNGCLGLVRFRVNQGAASGLRTPVAISNIETSDDTGVIEFSLTEPIASVSASLTVGPVEPDSDNDGIPDSWELENFLDPLLSNLGVDTDQDGRSDLLEYAFGGNPGIADPVRSPITTSIRNSGEDYLALTFDRRKESRLVYRVLESSNLGAWTEIAIVTRIFGVPQDHGDGTERITVLSSFPMTGNGAIPAGFMKVEVVSP